MKHLPLFHLSAKDKQVHNSISCMQVKRNREKSNKKGFQDILTVIIKFYINMSISAKPYVSQQHVCAHNTKHLWK